MQREPFERLQVDRAIQTKFIQRILLYWGGFLLLTMTLSWSLSFVVHWFVLQIPPSTPVLWRAFWVSQWTTVVAFLATLPAVVYDSMGVSRQFARPFSQLKQALKDLADGAPVQPLHVREDDFWRDVTRDFNRLLERVQPIAMDQSPSPEQTADSASPAECSRMAAK